MHPEPIGPIRTETRFPLVGAASSPCGACSTWSVGRGAHTPPNQAHSHRDPPPLHLVGAASSRPDRVLIRAGVQWFRPAWGRASCVRTAPPEPPGLRTTPPRSWRHVGMPPTRFDGGAAEIAGLPGRLLAAPTAHVRRSCGRKHTSSLFPQAKKPTCKNASRIFLCWRYLSSRAVARKVLSAKVSLTSVFGMGTGGPSPQSTPTSSRLFYLIQDVP